MGSAVLLHKEDYDGISRYDKMPGQIPSASRNLYEFVCVVEGVVEYWIEDQYYKISKGDVLLIPSGVMVSANLKQRGCPLVRHSVWVSHKFMTFLKLQDNNAAFGFAQALKHHAYLLRTSKDIYVSILQHFEDVEVEKQREDNINRELSSKAAVSTLVAHLNNVVKNHGSTMLLGGSKNRISPVLSYIHQHCTAALTVDKLAEKFEFSSSHLAHSFKKQLGISIYQYILLRRLQIGREAMLGGIPVREAYQKCGFGDYAGFYRAFLKEYGMSPQQYKKKNQ